MVELYSTSVQTILDQINVIQTRNGRMKTTKVRTDLIVSIIYTLMMGIYIIHEVSELLIDGKIYHMQSAVQKFCNGGRT